MRIKLLININLGFVMSNQKRNMPSKKNIKNYWKHKIVDIKHNIFPSVEYLCGGDYCFACGILTNDSTERAHILSRQEGGSDEVDNLHLLCNICHKDSEQFSGEEYNEWFINRTHIDAMLSIFYKFDYRLFKSFRENTNEVNLDLESIEFLNNFNSARKSSFDADRIIDKLSRR